LPPKAGHAALWYLAAVLLLTVYGIEVCPYLEGLGALSLAGTLGAIFAYTFVLRGGLYRLLPLAEQARSWHHLKLELALWAASGVLVTVWNTFWFEFPPESGMKVLVGTLTIGLFASTDQALRVENDEVRRVAAQEVVAFAVPGRYMSIATRFLIFIGFCLGFVVLVLLLVLHKDFVLAMALIAQGKEAPFTAIALEVTFVVGGVVVGCALVSRRLGQNLRLVHELQIAAMSSVVAGDYGGQVPVVSSDELGVIAGHTNRMIDGLREKERLQGVFGKLVSPTVAHEILRDEGGAELGGREVRAAVLFTDLRNFTGLSERNDARSVVRCLNEYFGMLVAAVHEHDGVVDKFIGDAAMAVFGLEGRDDGADRAFAAALAIRDGLGPVNDRLAAEGLPLLAQGIGVHVGSLIAGNIGSADRMEYTVVGDTVNTASRLEGMTKQLGRSVVVSAELYSALSEALQEQLEPLGDHAVKGRSEAVSLYGTAMPP